MFGYPDEIRRAVYTTNAIESLNMSLLKIIKTRASFPNDEAVQPGKLQLGSVAAQSRNKLFFENIGFTPCHLELIEVLPH
jgi:transposase-like protein